MTESIYFEALTEFMKLRTSVDRILSPAAALFGLTPV